jgi:hypothetical protein
MVKYISCRKNPKKVFIRHNIGIKQGISRGICFVVVAKNIWREILEAKNN